MFCVLPVRVERDCDRVMTLDATAGGNALVFVWAKRCLVPGGGNSVLRLQNVQIRL